VAASTLSGGGSPPAAGWRVDVRARVAMAAFTSAEDAAGDEARRARMAVGASAL